MGVRLRRGIVVAAALLAPIGGIMAAVSLSNASERQAPGIITIEGDGFLTVQGSNTGDPVRILGTIPGAPTGVITIRGDSIVNESPSRCKAGPDEAFCLTDRLTALQATLGGGDDRLTFKREFGGITIIGKTGAGDDKLFGGDSRDFLSGNGGEDTLEGGDGRDSLAGGRGADDLDGGPGRDDCDATRQDRRVKSCEEIRDG